MNQGISYTVDIILCIDATGSMSSVIERVKSSALQFYADIQDGMKKLGKEISELRLKVIVYRDYYVDGKDAMIESAFFSLPEEKEKFSSFVSSIRADGGGDEPENGLEALALAIKSDWSKTGHRRRQVVVIWTDASTHKLEKDAGSKPSNYPSDLPKDFDELTDWWEGQSYMSKAAKRLLMFAPDAYPWTKITNSWESAIHYESTAGGGLEEVDYSVILDYIARSI